MEPSNHWQMVGSYVVVAEEVPVDGVLPKCNTIDISEVYPSILNGGNAMAGRWEYKTLKLEALLVGRWHCVRSLR